MREFDLTVYINNMQYNKLDFEGVIDCSWTPNRRFLTIIQSNGNRTQIKESNIDMIIEVGRNCQ